MLHKNIIELSFGCIFTFLSKRERLLIKYCFVRLETRFGSRRGASILLRSADLPNTPSAELHTAGATRVQTMHPLHR